MNAKPYPKYKPSGVEWLGDVPDHWEVKPLKYIFPPLLSGVSVNSDNSEASQGYLGILKTSCVYGNKFRPEENKQVLGSEVDRVSCPATKDSLIISRMNTPELVGSCGYVDKDYPHLFLPDRLWIARFGGCNSKASVKFSWYLVISHGICSMTASLATGTSDSMKNLTQDAFLNISIGVPPHSEQIAIADFLDDRTAKLDALLEKKRTLIGKLKEKRSALISRTVTKGLPPEAAAKAGLTPSQKFKPSGIEWLGDIPEEWIAQKFGRCAFFQEGPGLRNWQFTVEGVKVICVTNITERGIDFTSFTKFISEEEYLSTYRHFTVSSGDLLLASSGNSWGKVAQYVDKETVILNTSTIRINRNLAETLKLPFILWTLQSETTREQLGVAMTGSCQPNFGPSHLSRVFVTVPPEAEQVAIATYLDTATAKIDRMIQKVESAIEKLTEYRTALITAAVTGKIDVRKSR